MNTFIISNNFEDTAKILDNKRLNKQITEGMQLILVFFRKLNIINDNKKGWLNHPVQKIWKDQNQTIYIYQLINYIDQMYYEWVRRSYKHCWIQRREYFLELIDNNKNLFGNKNDIINWTNDCFTIMKGNLLRKKFDYYSQFFGNNIEPVNGYLWENCFKINT